MLMIDWTKNMLYKIATFVDYEDDSCSKEYSNSEN